MLERLSIRDYAIIDNLEIEFGRGFNVFTGETGAGKSIIVGAMGLILGERGDSSVIRTGRDKAVVEAEFSVSDELTRSRLAQLRVEFPDNPNTLIIRREISAAGKTRVFINGYQETVTRLAEIGEWLVDIHGQHEHQLLLNQKVHLDILDTYGNLSGKRGEVASLYKTLLEKSEFKRELELDEKKLEEEKIFWESAVEDIDNAGLSVDEETELRESLKRMENAEAINRALSSSYFKLYEDELSVSARLTHILGELDDIRGLDPRYAEVYAILEDAGAKVDESVNLLSGYKDELEYDEAAIDSITDRLELIKDLKRKYRKNDIAELIEYAKECENKLSRFENRVEELLLLDKEIAEIKQKIADKAMELSKMRQDIAVRLSSLIKAELSFLAMDKAEFIVDIKYVKDEESPIEINGKRIKISESGIDRVEFLISSNPGEEPRPLRKVASGGEISRIMLALKTILAKSDAIGTLVFDEIDAGIGGVTANNVAQKMKELANHHQTIAITHLPQIASKASTHFHVSKTAKEGRTYTEVRRLENDVRVSEIARMLGGETQTAITHAKEMLYKT
jgi:DNA repair protein RecN (Recombination protein N)